MTIVADKQPLKIKKRWNKDDRYQIMPWAIGG
jgi:hypothetical protein